MSEEGYMTAQFTWRNHHGYEYRIVGADDGCFEVRYFEDDDLDPKSVLSFNDLDADDLIRTMREAVQFWRREKDRP